VVGIRDEGVVVTPSWLDRVARSHFPVPVFEVAAGGVMTQSLGRQVDGLVCTLQAFDPAVH